MPDTYGTRPLSWYADCAPDYLDTDEDDERDDMTEEEWADLEFERRRDKKRQ